MHSVQDTANPETQKPPKTIKDLVSLYSTLESNFENQLTTLQTSTTEQLCKLNNLVESLIASKTDASATSTPTPIVEESNSVAAVTVAIQEMQQRLDDQIAAVKASVAKELGVVKTDIDRLYDDTQVLADLLDEGEQYSRRNCLLLHGIAEHPGENVLATALNFVNGRLGNPSEVLLRCEDVDRVHRLGPLRKTFADTAKSSGRPRPIILKLSRYIPRALIWDRKRRLKGTEFLITESLTAIRSKLLKTAKEMAGKHKVWTQDGRIIVLSPDSSSRLTITKERDLRQLRLAYPNSTTTNPV